MGVSNSKTQDKEIVRNVISFPKSVEMGFVQGGDLIFIQDDSLFDGYTKMNTQTSHAMKKVLRMKTKLESMDVSHSWCRMGIVLDSQIPQIKYLLELTDNGFIKNEYMSRVLYLKSQKAIIGIKRLRVQLTENQSKSLQLLADRFVGTFAKKSQMAGIYDIDTTLTEDEERQEEEIKDNGPRNFGEERSPTKKNKFAQDALENNSDFDFKKQQNKENRGDQFGGGNQFGGGGNSDEEQPLNTIALEKFAHVDIMKVALLETKSILMTIDEDGLMYAQLWEIFKIFAGSSREIIDNPDMVMEESSEHVSNTSKHFVPVRDIAQASRKTMELRLLPQFITYFKVSDDDHLYFEEVIQGMAKMVEVESYVAEGITFRHLINEMHESNFFMTTQLTEVEPTSCFNAQVFMLILERIGLLTDNTERASGQFKDVNDMCENPDQRSEEAYARGLTEFAPIVYTPTLTVQTII